MYRADGADAVAVVQVPAARGESLAASGAPAVEEVLGRTAGQDHPTGSIVMENDVGSEGIDAVVSRSPDAEEVLGRL